jgi:uncharacterized protein with beta-barrel porin domain
LHYYISSCYNGIIKIKGDGNMRKILFVSYVDFSKECKIAFIQVDGRMKVDNVLVESILADKQCSGLTSVINTVLVSEDKAETGLIKLLNSQNFYKGSVDIYNSLAFAVSQEAIADDITKIVFSIDVEDSQNYIRLVTVTFADGRIEDHGIHSGLVSCMDVDPDDLLAHDLLTINIDANRLKKSIAVFENSL